MDGVWERRERSLTEPQWDNEGRADKAAWGSGKAAREGSSRLNSKWQFSQTRHDRLYISKMLPPCYFILGLLFLSFIIKYVVNV